MCSRGAPCSTYIKNATLAPGERDCVCVFVYVRGSVREMVVVYRWKRNMKREIYETYISWISVHTKEEVASHLAIG